MANSLYQQMNNSNNLSGLVQQFNEFRQNFQGNPQQMIQQLMQSGRMSQADYNRYHEMAQQFMRILPR